MPSSIGSVLYCHFLLFAAACSQGKTFVSVCTIRGGSGTIRLAGGHEVQFQRFRCATRNLPHAALQNFNLHLSQLSRKTCLLAAETKLKMKGIGMAQLKSDELPSTDYRSWQGRSRRHFSTGTGIRSLGRFPPGQSRNDETALHYIYDQRLEARKASLLLFSLDPTRHNSG